MPRSTPARVPAEDVLLAALEHVGGGAVVVLDRELRVVAASRQAVELVGSLPRGVSAPKVLCGGSSTRPIAEALAAGRAVVATIRRPGPDDERLLRVSATPVMAGTHRVGWALLIDAEPEGEGPELFEGMLSVDPAMRSMFRIVEKVARSNAGVLVRGETGSGKELVATALHARSLRSRGPFRAINCAAMPAQLLESELFGHARGAFTGAVRDNPGHFALAEKGTLFLDEIAELPLELQAKLLRVLDTHTVMPVGGREPRAVDVRVVAATNRALRHEVEAGRFRADLMYRLRVIPVFIPPLRARRADILPLAERFVDEMNARGGRKISRFSRRATDVLMQYHWPGNVRELRNILEYAFVIGDGPVLVEADLPAELTSPGTDGNPLALHMNVPPALPANVSPEAARLLRALERSGGSRERAAKSLGISRVTLWRRMKELALVEDERQGR